MDAPAFPAIAISPGDSFLAVPALPTDCTAHALRNGYFSRLYFFDSRGLCWPVRAAHASPTFLDRMLGRRIAVRVELADPRNADLGDVVRDLCELIDADPDDLYDQEVSPETLKSRLHAASSPRELIAVVQAAG